MIPYERLQPHSNPKSTPFRQLYQTVRARFVLLEKQYRPCDLAIHEDIVCESLRRSPMPILPNITVQSSKMIELSDYFEKHSETSAKRWEDESRPIDTTLCLQGINNGLEHLHSLGFIYNDINPEMWC
jgi:hypothetical protein